MGTQTRGRTGMEVNPLVFETSASTDSAIWALPLDLRCKGTTIFEKDKKMVEKIARKQEITSFIAAN